jgi:ribonuclease Z
MILKAYSKGLYSNWFYYAPDRVLFDCGEGVSLFMKTGIFAIEKIILSHGHMDHIAGLYSVLCLRQSTKGDNLKPLTIYYPENDRSIAIIKDSIDAMLSRFIQYPLEWIAIKAGDRIPLRKDRFIKAFSAIHSGSDPLGFTILEPRKRLKTELIGKPGRELAAIPFEKKFDHYDAKLFCYSGDTMPLPITTFAGAKLLIHDATFLDVGDRKAPLHSSAQEAFDIAAEAKVEKLIISHISPRYHGRKHIISLLNKLQTHEVDYDWILPGRVFEI